MKSIVGLLLLIGTTSGCGLLLGRVKPVEEKAENYHTLDLSGINPDWLKLHPQKDPNNPGESSDIAYQSKKTASIISLDSACRKNIQPGQDLHQLTQELLLGITDITHQSEKNISLDGKVALETTLQGKLNHESMILRTVVSREGTCVYDFMYIARPENFSTHVADFQQFVSSFKISP